MSTLNAKKYGKSACLFFYLLVDAKSWWIALENGASVTFRAKEPLRLSPHQLAKVLSVLFLTVPSSPGTVLRGWKIVQVRITYRQTSFSFNYSYGRNRNFSVSEKNRGIVVADARPIFVDLRPTACIGTNPTTTIDFQMCVPKDCKRANIYTLYLRNSLSCFWEVQIAFGFYQKYGGWTPQSWWGHKKGAKHVLQGGLSLLWHRAEKETKKTLLESCFFSFLSSQNQRGADAYLKNIIGCQILKARTNQMRVWPAICFFGSAPKQRTIHQQSLKHGCCALSLRSACSNWLFGLFFANTRTEGNTRTIAILVSNSSVRVGANYLALLAF